MFPARVASAALFFTLFFFGLFHPWFGWVLPAIFVFATVTGVHEFTNLGVHRPSRVWVALTLASALGLLADAYFARLMHAVMILSLTTVAMLTFGLLQGRRNVAELAGKCLMSVVYIALPLALLMNLWRGPVTAGVADAQHYLIFFLLVTWSSDIGAYLIGRLIGRHKLAPRLSPGKTIEGTLGGVVFTLVVAVAVKLCWNNVDRIFAWWEILTLAAAFSVIAPIGDLAESQLKRTAGQKDSGHTFTGHGGMLDIIDSLLFTTVFYYVWLRLLHPGVL